MPHPSSANDASDNAADQYEWSECVRPLHSSAMTYVEKQEFPSAIREWQHALTLAKDREERAWLFVHRSRAYSDFSKHLRSIPASFSEVCAQNAVDPTQLAQLALKDANKALAEKADWTVALNCRGRAQLLLEEYEASEDSFLQVLSHDADDREALDGLRELKTILAAAGADAAPRRKRRLTQDADDLECSICAKLFWKPVTTPCGHTFCHACFARSMDHNSRCPMCRRVLHTGRDLPVTGVLHNLILKHFPQEAEERRRESSSFGGGEGRGVTELPVFVMTPMLPHEKMALNIFEPRYRLMVRRCMEGHKLLVMTCSFQAEGEEGSCIAPVACECSIEECQVQPDGRYHIELLGARRVKVLRDWEVDGYRMCEPAPMEDAAADKDLSELCQKLESKIDSMLSTLQQMIQVATGHARIQLMARLQDMSAKPPISNTEDFSFWAASILVRDPRDKLKVLMMTDTEERLQMLLSKDNAFGGTCSLM